MHLLLCLLHGLLGLRQFLDQQIPVLVGDADQGHLEAGTAVRRAFAGGRRRLGGRRVLDAVGRFGGDEFAVLWCQSSESDFRRMQGTVRAQLQEVRWGDAPHQNGISVSAGALWVADATQISLRVALARADMLLYAAKRGGKNQVSFEAGDDLDSSSRI